MSTIALILLLFFGYFLFGPWGVFAAYVVVTLIAFSVLMNTSGSF